MGVIWFLWLCLYGIWGTYMPSENIGPYKVSYVDCTTCSAIIIYGLAVISGGYFHGLPIPYSYTKRLQILDNDCYCSKRCVDAYITGAK